MKKSFNIKAIFTDKNTLYKYSVVKEGIIVSEINPVLYQNELSKFPQIQSDYEEVKKRVDKENKLPSIFDVCPIFRRVERVPDKIEADDYIPAAGLVSLAVLNAPEDWRDMKSAYSQMKATSNGKSFPPSYDYKKAQHPFSFFRGTLLHKFVNPATSPCPKFAKWLLKNDTTLWDTKLGDFITKLFNIETYRTDTKIKNINYAENNPSFVIAKEFKSKNPFGELTARAMTRTTKIGAAVLGGLEAAHLVKEISDGENAIKSAAKSAISFTSSIAGIGYGGAIGAKYFGPVGSLVGMGLGAIAGNTISDIID